MFTHRFVSLFKWGFLIDFNCFPNNTSSKGNPLTHSLTQTVDVMSDLWAVHIFKKSVAGFVLDLPFYISLALYAWRKFPFEESQPRDATWLFDSQPRVIKDISNQNLERSALSPTPAHCRFKCHESLVAMETPSTLNISGEIPRRQNFTPWFLAVYLRSAENETSLTRVFLMEIRVESSRLFNEIKPEIFSRM